MGILIGTGDGVFRADGAPFDGADLVLDTGRAHRIREFEGFDGVFAATSGGLYRSFDDGRSWENLAVPVTQVWSVFGAADGRLYAGTQPAHLFYTTDEGETWTELESFRRQPTVGLWRSAYGPDAHVRTIGGHPETPERVFAGVEAGGLYRSEDAGETWAKCEVLNESDVNQDDIHQVLPVSSEECFVACGRLSIHDRNHAAAEGGVYHTVDAGGSWTRADATLEPSYFRALLLHDGVLYACGATTVPPEWYSPIGAEATMFTSRDLGETFEEVPFPGGPDEMLLSWATDGDRVFGGTDSGREQGRVIYHDPGKEWQTAGFVPNSVHSLYAR